MSALMGQQVLEEVELAMGERNYGRLYDLGLKLVKQASYDTAWLEAVVVISKHLSKSAAHLWDAVDLSKRAALQAPERSRMEALTVNALVVCINSFPEPDNRIKASYSVVTMSPVGAPVIIVCLGIMLHNIPDIQSPRDQQRYIKMVIRYAPRRGPLADRAQRLMQENDLKLRSLEPAYAVEERTASPLAGFLQTHVVE